MFPELALSQWVLLTSVTLLAGAVQTATGFGFAVIAVPFFLIALDSVSAIQINIVLNLFNALVVAPRIWRAAPQLLLRGLIGGTFIGLPAGMLVYLYADLVHIKMGVAILILAFATHLVFSSRREMASRHPGTKGTWFTGGVSGTLSSALAMPGPPVLIYLSHFAIDKESFRAVNLSLYVVSYAGALALQTTIGQMSAPTWALSVALIPLAALGGIVGHWISPWLSQRVYKITVLVTLIVTGFYMLYATLFG